jgi:hypothetical protein
MALAAKSRKLAKKITALKSSTTSLALPPQ